MSRKAVTWLLLVFLIVIVAAAILAATWAASAFWHPRFPWRQRQPPLYGIPGDIEFYYIAKTVVSTVNIAVLAFLVFAYADIYRKTRSEFTVGLIIFSVTLLLYALSSNPMVMAIFGFAMFGVGPFALLPDLFTFAALTALLYLTMKY